MELNLSAESSARLSELAQRTQRGTDELPEEAVGHLVNYSEWVGDRVRRSIEASDRGELTSDEQVRTWIESRERADAY